MVSKYTLGSCIFVLAAVAGVAHGQKVGKKGTPLKSFMPWYHTSDEIQSDLRDLATACQGAQVQIDTRSQVNAAEAAGQNVDLDVLRISGSASNNKIKVMLVFGEHARELISAESARDFVHTLCGLGPNGKRAGQVLEKADFVIVPNANPVGRRQVEEGYYCKRTNEDGVDLNRNWGDDHRGKEKPGDEMNPGPNGFSEPESIILRDLVTQERPDVYLSIHSGAYLLGTPWGYSAERSVDNKGHMMEVLKPISEQYCGGGCPYGGLAELIGYKSEGCDIDYVHEQLGTPYAFTWEIYVGPAIRSNYIEEARMRSEGQGLDEEAQDFFSANKNLNLVQEAKRGRHRLRSRTSVASRMVALQTQIREFDDTLESQEDPDGCTEQFNPPTESETRAVVENWSGAYLELCERVAAQPMALQVAKPKQTTSDGSSNGAAGVVPNLSILAWEKELDMSAAT